ncbi:MAG: GGDEF domain-containing protein [Deltaproteobacteria bacterium]|nr:GGDEF domain-containing protein [Deltaproteobacteria bacterium]
MNTQMKQEALDVVIAELEKSLVVLQGNYQKAVSNLNQLRECVSKDDLTRLLRRSVFMQRLESLLFQAREEGREVHVLMVDVDHFKRVNDTHGHQTGDVVLQQISELITRYLRPGDLAGRYGGEELILAMEGGTVEVQAIADRIRQAVEGHSMKSRSSVEFSCTLSVGVASARKVGYGADILIESADAALYRAKNSGRNRVELAIKLDAAEAAKPRAA